MKLEKVYSLLGVLVLVLGWTATASAAALASGATGEDVRSAALAQQVDEMASRGDLSGVVLVARDGEVVLEKAMGLARRGPDVACTPRDRFNIGSITKVFTRVIVQQLAHEGRLDLDEPIARSLPGYPDADVARRVTARQLLEMSSGLGDFFGERFAATPKDEIRSLSDYLKLFQGRPLEFEPGTSRRYSNAGFIVLGLIIEKLTGESYDQVLAKRVFGPAGMTGSALLERSHLPEDAAIGYTREGWERAMQGGEPPAGEPVSNVDTLPGRGSSAGGSYATARDLLAFDRALKAGTLGDTAFWRGNGGLGVAGGAPGVNAVLESDWQTGWTVVVLSNLDPPSAERAGRALRTLLGWPADS